MLQLGVIFVSGERIDSLDSYGCGIPVSGIAEVAAVSDQNEIAASMLSLLAGDLDQPAAGRPDS